MKKETTGKTTLVVDGRVPNLFVKTYPSGNQVYIYRGWLPETKKRKEVKIGETSRITIQQARQKAKELAADFTLGQGVADPDHELETITFRDAANRWIKSLEKMGRAKAYIDNERSLLDKYVLPKIGNKTVRSITYPELAKIADDRISAGKPNQSKKIHTLLSMVLNFSVRNGFAEQNLMASYRSPVKPAVRTRVLSRDEIKAVLHRLKESEHSEDTKDVILTIIHTGQRRGEVLGMVWGEIDIEKALWVIPGDRVKNGVTHVVPLSDSVMAILKKRLPKKSKPKADQLVFDVAKYSVGQACRRMSTQLKIPKFGPHDLRRTLASTLPSIDPQVTEDLLRRIINHISGRGAMANYAHYLYLDEKRAALAKWSAWLDSL